MIRIKSTTKSSDIRTRKKTPIQKRMKAKKITMKKKEWWLRGGRPTSQGLQGAFRRQRAKDICSERHTKIRTIPSQWKDMSTTILLKKRRRKLSILSWALTKMAFKTIICILIKLTSSLTRKPSTIRWPSRRESLKLMTTINSTGQLWTKNLNTKKKRFSMTIDLSISCRLCVRSGNTTTITITIQKEKFNIPMWSQTMQSWQKMGSLPAENL